MTISMTLRWAINSMANGLGIGGMAVVARRIVSPSLIFSAVEVVLARAFDGAGNTVQPCSSTC